MAANSDVVLVLGFWSLTNIIVYYLRDRYVVPAPTTLVDVQPMFRVFYFISNAAYMLAITLVLYNPDLERIISATAMLWVAIFHNMLGSTGLLLQEEHPRLSLRLAKLEVLILYGLDVGELMAANWWRFILFATATIGRAIHVYQCTQTPRLGGKAKQS